jgi:hypothetical protein
MTTAYFQERDHFKAVQWQQENIKKNLQRTGCENVDWIDLAPVNMINNSSGLIEGRQFLLATHEANTNTDSVHLAARTQVF